VTPFAEAQWRANEILAAKFISMFVTMSWAGEYVTAIDVEGQMPIDGQVKQIQARLTALGFAPGAVDGIIGPRTLAAILAALAKVPDQT
jgi:hypothetical protein